MGAKKTEIVARKPAEIDFARLEQVLIYGDLSSLSPKEKVEYNHRLCEAVGLNHIMRPFEYIKFKGKETLYAKKEGTEQLRRNNNISITLTEKKREGDLYVVTAQASTPSGRVDEATGVMFVGKLTGEDLANAYMKTETKAKRRVTLSICGLGMLDESEIENADKDTPSERTLNADVDSQPTKSLQAEIVNLVPEQKDPLDEALDKAPMATVTKPAEAAVEEMMNDVDGAYIERLAMMTRASLAKEITGLRERFGISTKELSSIIEDEFKKPSTELTDTEMRALCLKLNERG